MVGFARDVTTEIKIPEVKAPNFADNRSTAEDVVDVLGFGLQLFQQKQARSEQAEQKRISLEGLAIAKRLNPLRGTMSNVKFMNFANQLVRDSGGGLEEQSMIGSIVASEVFGAKNLGIAAKQTDEEFRGDLDVEFRGLGVFGDQAIASEFSDSTSSELSNDQMEKVIEKGRILQQDAVALAERQNTSTQLIEQGNIDAVSSWLKDDKTQSNNIGTVMLNLYGKALNQANRAGLQLVAEDLQQMKESAINVFQSFKTNLQDKFSGDVLLRFDSKKATQVESQVDNRIKYYDDQINFLKEMEVEEFNNYATAAKLLEDKDSIDLQRTVPELMKFKEVFGPQAMASLITELLVKDPGFREQLKSATVKGLEATGVTSKDRFAIGMGIVAGIGEGRTIQDYDSEESTNVSNTYWKTTQGFINTPGLIDNSTPGGVTQMAIAAVQVLEFAEERGTVEDKQRALKTINSPEFKKLYDKVSPEIKNAMGRKIIQYNRDTFSDNASRLLSERMVGQEIKFNADSGRFELKQTRQIVSGSRDPRTQKIEEQRTVQQNTEIRLQQQRVDALNKQLDIVKIYGKDDPFISSLSDKEARDFFVRSAGLPASVIKGTLSQISSQQQEASVQGVTVKELEARTDIVAQTKKAASLFAKLEDKVATANISPDIVAEAQEVALDFLAGKKPVQSVEDTSDLDDEEFEEFIKQMRAERGSK